MQRTARAQYFLNEPGAEQSFSIANWGSMTPLCWPSAIGFFGPFRTNLGHCIEYWRVVRFAVLMATSYIVWLRVFECWLEPLARRGVGRFVGAVIVWVPAVGPFRIWGLRDRPDSAGNAAVGVVGYVTILLSAIVPAALWQMVSGGRSDERHVRASIYLASVIMTSLLVVRLLVGKAEAC